MSKKLTARIIALGIIVIPVIILYGVPKYNHYKDTQTLQKVNHLERLLQAYYYEHNGYLPSEQELRKLYPDVASIDRFTYVTDAYPNEHKVFTYGMSTAKIDPAAIGDPKLTIGSAAWTDLTYQGYFNVDACQLFGQCDGEGPRVQR